MGHMVLKTKTMQVLVFQQHSLMFNWNNVLLKFSFPCAKMVYGERRKDMEWGVFLKIPQHLVLGKEENTVVKS